VIGSVFQVGITNPDIIGIDIVNDGVQAVDRRIFKVLAVIDKRAIPVCPSFLILYIEITLVAEELEGAAEISLGK
jgi:hypothetical protein